MVQDGLRAFVEGVERDVTAAFAWLKTYPQGGADWGRVREIALEAGEAPPARHLLRREGLRRSIAAADPRLAAQLHRRGARPATAAQRDYQPQAEPEHRLPLPISESHTPCLNHTSS